MRRGAVFSAGLMLVLLWPVTNAAAQSIQPTTEGCITWNADGTYEQWFGYTNPGATVSVDYGPDNFLRPARPVRPGQPTTILSGIYDHVFPVSSLYGERTTWTLDGAQASTTPDGPFCSDGPSAFVAPKVLGTPAMDEVLAVDPGRWASDRPVSEIAVRWQRCTGEQCVDIEGEEGEGFTHRVADTDVGHSLRAVVSETSVGETGTASSPSVGPVAAPPDPPAPAPTVSLATGQGDVLRPTEGARNASLVVDVRHATSLEWTLEDRGGDRMSLRHRRTTVQSVVRSIRSDGPVSVSVRSFAKLPPTSILRVEATGAGGSDRLAVPVFPAGGG